MNDYVEMIISEAILRLKNITKEKFYDQVFRLKETIVSEVCEFNPNKEYFDVYTEFRKSVDCDCIGIFTEILEASARIILHEIYLLCDDINSIDMNYDFIRNASAKKRKHFDVAKNIAIKTIKMYSLNTKSSKRIIDYVDEYLPSSYIKSSDIDLVVWYFLVCIVTYNLFLKNRVA